MLLILSAYGHVTQLSKILQKDGRPQEQLQKSRMPAASCSIYFSVLFSLQDYLNFRITMRKRLALMKEGRTATFNNFCF